MAHHRLAACLMNISEGRNMNVVEAVANAVSASRGKSPNSPACRWLIEATVLNVFSDHDYNRSVITIAAPVQFLKEKIISACKVAYNKIDISQQVGGHPRLGAVDLIPIYPLSPSVSLEECGSIAKDVATTLAAEIPGTSFFMFGAADTPEKRGLVARRKEVGWFSGRAGVKFETLRYDIGQQPSSSYGLTGAGASFYVMNCNVTIRTDNLSIGQKIAQSIREASPGGLPGLQVMAFPHDGNIEVACNVESFAHDEDVVRDQNLEKEEENVMENPHLQNKTVDLCESNFKNLKHSEKLSMQDVQDFSYTKTVGKMWRYCSPQVIEHRVAELAKSHGVRVVGTALVGFTPEEAYHLSVECLQKGNGEHWKMRHIKYQSM